MTAATDFNWTDDRVEQLKQLQADGLSCSLIAAEIGGITRNAVIGKLHRLGLSGRGQPSQTKYGPRRPRVPRVAREPGARRSFIVPRRQRMAFHNFVDVADYGPRPTEHRLSRVKGPPTILDRTFRDVPPPAGIEPRRIPFLDTEERHCRWPIGDPRSADFVCCGLDRVMVTVADETMPDPRTHYCPFHLNASANRGVSHGA